MSLSRIVSAGESRRMTASPDNSLWVIVTPVFKPAPGGGAIYADILARALAGAGADVVVFAERHPGTSAEEALVTRRGSARVCRILPFRAGRAEIGRAACRERVGQYVWISGGAGTLKKNNTYIDR